MVWALCGLSSVMAQQRGIEFFEQRIRPVLIQHCYECHNSLETQEGGLALDHRGGLLEGGDSGPAVQPKNPASSLLLKVIRHEIEGQEMPDGGPKLTDEVISDFAKWIGMGAPDPRDGPPTPEDFAKATSWATVLEERKQWWSFQPIARPTPPEASGWSDHPVDRFVIEKLSQAGLKPAKPADSHTLLRRLTFAITGLPPTLEQMETFVDDESSDQIPKLVDQLLESPHFGERWARHWMDWIRYAESHGSEGDPEINNAWQYRDYLIRALNQDVPYDQLLREHIAGDLLDSPRVNHKLGINESIIGTSHWRMVFHGFAPTDALDERVRFTDDQINAFSKAFLGLTVSCARCHNHKFDAISQADYYALFGVLASCRPGRVAIDLPKKLNRNRKQLTTLKQKIRRSLAQDWSAALPSLPGKLTGGDEIWKEVTDAEWLLHPWHELKRRTDAGEQFAEVWNDLNTLWKRDRESRRHHASRTYSQHWNLATDDFREWYSHGNGLTEQPTKNGDFTIQPEGENAIAHVLPPGAYSNALSDKHAGRLSSPDFHVDRQYVLWMRVLGKNASVRYVVQDYPRNGTVYPVSQLADKWRWQKFELGYWEGDDIHIEVTTDKDAPLLVRDNDRGWFGIREAFVVKQGDDVPPDKPLEHLDPVFEMAASVRDFDSLAAAYVKAISAAIDAFAEGDATAEQALLLDACLREGLLPNELETLTHASGLIEAYRKYESEIPVATRVPSLEETAARDQPFFERGNHRRPGTPVPRRFLEAIDASPYGDVDSGRRRLAEDLVRDDNPLSRRVIVNRIWHHLFGRGLVATPDNLGRLGSAPSHPELLDYLANRFSEREWSVKQMIRFLVTSKTWQLDATPSPRAREVDPDNLLWSHARIRRMEAESIRDALLFVSGRLDLSLYGPPTDGQSDRRSIYVRVQRNQLDPFLRVFDFPEPYSATGRRDATNVPAQSLTMLNDEHVRRTAEAWAERVAAREFLSDDRERVEHMLAAALGRPPVPSDVVQAFAYLREVQQDDRTTRNRRRELRSQIATRTERISSILGHARELLQQDDNRPRQETVAPPVVARWDFDKNAHDSEGRLDLSLRDGAKILDGALKLDGERAHAVSDPLPFPLRAKTLEAWVKLSDLDQRGSGVMTVQTTDGVTFDSIVFGEQEPKQWLPGSDNFRRTEPLNGPGEETATDDFVQIVISYHEDGRIACYRNGAPYGRAYKSGGPVHYKAGQAVVSFGVRHLPAEDGRMLDGEVKMARLYDRALNEQQVRATASAQGRFIPESKVLDSLPIKDRESVSKMRSEISHLESALQSLGPESDQLGDQHAWAELALAIFNLKEFIYLR